MTNEWWSKAVKQRREEAEKLLNVSDLITDPPCRFCAYWHPRVETSEHGLGVWIMCCHKFGDMEHDFSCFKMPSGPDRLAALEQAIGEADDTA